MFLLLYKILHSCFETCGLLVIALQIATGITRNQSLIGQKPVKILVIWADKSSVFDR